MRLAGGNVVTPDSSIARSTDIGMRAHTNIHVFLPTKPMKELQPLGASCSGYSYETPESLACVFGLVKTVTGWAPSAANTNPTGRAKMIAIVDAWDARNAARDLAAFPRRTPQSEASFARPCTATRCLTGDQWIGDQWIAVDKHAAGAIHDCVSPSLFGEQNFYAKPG
jgi:hypothetical protein